MHLKLVNNSSVDELFLSWSDSRGVKDNASSIFLSYARNKSIQAYIEDSW